MHRREFLTIAGGAVVAWPCLASAQQSAVPVVGVISLGSSGGFSHLIAALRKGLRETGYDEGRNVQIEYRWAEGRPDRLPAMATELVGMHVAAILATGGSLPALAAKSATTNIPILFSSGTDPVKAGLVSDFNRPGGNVTGIYMFTSAMEAKRTGLLRDLVPGAKIIGVLANPTYPAVDVQITEVQEGARALGLQTEVFHAAPQTPFEKAFAEMAQSRVDALIVCSDPYFNSQRKQIISLAARHGIPAIYQQSEFATDGGLASYGISITNVYRQLGIYTGRVLKGEKPVDLPVVQSTKFEFVLNLRTAKALGLTFSPNVLSLADEVIE